MGSLLSFSPARMINQCMKIYFNSCGLFSRIVELDNGTTMHCWMPQTVAVSGSSSLKLARTDDKKPALVFLHAFGADAFTWVRQISRFSKCFDLYIPDLLFCGDSYTTNPSRTEFFQVTDCCLTVFFFTASCFSYST
jgi:pimeloyl-ACP methyl ester carboxylesterase